MEDLIQSLDDVMSSLEQSDTNYFVMMNGLAMISAHLESLEDVIPAKSSDVRQCLGIIAAINPETTTEGKIRAAIIALDGRIKMLIHD